MFDAWPRLKPLMLGSATRGSPSMNTSSPVPAPVVRRPTCTQRPSAIVTVIVELRPFSYVVNVSAVPFASDTRRPPFVAFAVEKIVGAVPGSVDRIQNDAVYDPFGDDDSGRAVPAY